MIKHKSARETNNRRVLKNSIKVNSKESNSEALIIAIKDVQKIEKLKHKKKLKYEKKAKIAIKVFDKKIYSANIKPDFKKSKIW
jgi:hypothetical protein